MKMRDDLFCPSSFKHLSEETRHCLVPDICLLRTGTNMPVQERHSASQMAFC